MLIDGPHPRLYNLAEDPGEVRDLAAQDPERLVAMRRLLGRRKRQLAAGGVEAREDSISPEKQARLASLGYLGGRQIDPEGIEISADLPDPHQAIKVFREMNEGKQLTEQGRPRLAAAVLERAKASDPTNPFLVLSLARAYQQMGDTAALRQELDHLLAIAPEHLAGHLMLAEVMASGSDDAGTLRALERALELDPRNQATQLVYAYRLEDLKRYREAGAAYQQLLDLAPGHVLARNGYATLLYRLGEVNAAVDGLQHLLRDQPFFAPAHLNLAVVRHDQGRLEDSERQVRRALELRPTYGAAYELHALNLELLAEPELARQAWRQAWRFATSDAARERAASYD